MIEKIISGGQRGADIAGLRAAKQLGLKTGGYMPLGWETLDGPKPEYAWEYGMEEVPSEDYPLRTKMNVMWSNGTMRFAVNWNRRGEQATLREIKKFRKPYLDIDIHYAIFSPESVMKEARAWIQRHNIRILNVAGNSHEAFEEFVEAFLIELIESIPYDSNSSQARTTPEPGD